MEIGIGIDPTARLTWDERREIIREAAQLGYASAWTPAGLGNDAFQVCTQWWQASTEVVEGGIGTGISVVPVPIWTVPALATITGALADLSGGHFILGIGSGSIHDPGYRQMFGLEAVSPIKLMRDYLVTLRALLAGETVTHEGPAVTLRNVRLGIPPTADGKPVAPVYLAALGPQMLRLAGEASDGAALNWCSAEQVDWSREIVAEGARKAGRDPREINMMEYIRICVDEDETVARRAFAKAVMGYALARGDDKGRGYRAHFARMGFDAALTELEDRRDRGAPADELADAFPDALLRLVGYYGKAEGAAAAFKRVAGSLDTAIVRVVPARPGAEAVRAVMNACAPEKVRSAG
jgi:alkanesulfonate monooxygenase SsuD/methylene tetrahydromethanopterin reductase-like flavin-dependent oxidoreductase (luciferase family)